jgi:class 3 adenylate cyclase
MTPDQASTINDLQRKLGERSAECDALQRELTETAKHQAATAEVLQVINSSPGDLAPVFEAMLEKAMRLCRAAFGFMTVFDGERFKHAAQHGVPAALANYLSAGMDQPRPGDAHARLLAGEDVVHNIDQKDEDAYRSGNPLRRAVVDLGGTRTALVVALRKDGRVLGAFTIYRKEVRPFSDKEIELVKNFAAQAVVAMENARLITEVERLRAAAERARHNLSRYFSPNIVDLLAAQDEPLGAVRRETIAVLFADIVGFTTMAEAMPPEAVMTLLRQFHERMTAQIFACGGMVEKYIGDAIVAVFGVPNPGADDAANALVCADRMLRALEVWNVERSGGTPLALGIGLNYGPAVLGDVGSEHSMSFTVIGDTVNTASRLQGLTRTLKTPLVVGDPLVRAIRAGPPGAGVTLAGQLQDRGEQALRGRAGAVRIWTRPTQEQG